MGRKESKQTNKQNSLTENFVQQNNIPAKLYQVLTRFHKLNKAKLPSNGRLNRRFYNKTEYEIEKDSYKCLLVFVVLRPKSTAMVIAGRSVHLTTLFPGQA